jgi:hypothetical protein
MQKKKIRKRMSSDFAGNSLFRHVERAPLINMRNHDEAHSDVLFSGA